MPVYPKRRFQHGSVAPGVVDRLFRGDEEGYRRHFQALHANTV
jgi:asparagine synthase (glutamine-hydrolysing)